MSGDELRLFEAGLDELDEVARLFDAYRQFYEQPPDLDLARDFIRRRMANGESTIFLARLGGSAAGFVQLYPTFCSVYAIPIWVLYDLFVDPGCRRAGIGEALMNRARRLAEETGAGRIDLSTATDNVTAQRLYERLGYERDTEFYVYSLVIDGD